MDLSHQRNEYSQGSIDVDSVDSCPFRQFEVWFKEANDQKLLEPNAMTLSTVSPEGHPAQRTVLLKYFDSAGFVFFTNYGSRKAQHIDHNPAVSLLFPWIGLQRQVEVAGRAERVSLAESMKYFALRPRGSQLGAWASNQSAVVSGRSVLKNKLAELTKKFGTGAIPMPRGWGGFRVTPVRIEFWQGGVNRLHDRIEYLRVDGDDGNESWQRRRLAP